MNPYDLSGRVALVTGAAVGIGRAVAVALAEAGAAVGIHYHSSAREAEETLGLLQQGGGRGFLLQADLADEKQARTTVDELISRAGRLDVLVNNAGSPLSLTCLEDCPADLWRRAFDVNVHSAFYVTQ
jgi:3-oxoacyl-[acyl-carrier protein] reductase